MTRPLVEIDADIAAIRVVMGTAAKKVRFADGREVEYHSQKDQERAIAFLEDERARALDAPPVTTVVGRYNSGFGR